MEFSIDYIDILVGIKNMVGSLTKDNPEDLILSRAVFQKCKHLSPRFTVNQII